jgi:poly(3-hydroxybutyrate) depolymerase
MREIKKLLLLFIVGISLNTTAFAQIPECESDYYLHPVFDSVTVIHDVIYGHNISVGGEPIDLKMDIYEPFQDTNSSRPVIFVVHGGGFTSGSKSGGRFVKLSKNYASRGYIAVSIDYRLYDLSNPPDSFLLKDAVVRAMGDLKAAMRYMHEDADTENNYAVDTTNFFLCGVSSGAIISNTTAFLDDLDEADPQMHQLISSHGGLQGNSSSNIQYHPQPKAVLNSSGGLFDPSYIDDSGPKLVSIHCVADPVMPFEKDWLRIQGDSVIEAYGSKILHEMAEMNGLDHQLIEVPGEVHLQYYFDPFYYDSMMVSSSRKFKEVICSDSTGGLPVTIREINMQPDSYLYPNPSSDFVSIHGAESGELGIYNSVGIRVRNEYFTGNKIKITDLLPGIYFMILHEEDKIHRHRFLVSR